MASYRFDVRVIVAVMCGMVLTDCSPAVAQEVAAKTELRVAILESTAGIALPASLQDLLFAELSQQPDVQLVERAEIARILREQGIAASSATSLIQLGDILAADVVVLLEQAVPSSPPAEVESGTSQPIRLRVLDTRSGLKVDDSVHSWISTSPDLSAAQLARETGKQLARVRAVRAGGLLVGVSEFTSLEITRTADWLGPLLSAGLEQRLLPQPGLVLMERQATLPLVDERRLTIDQLPASISSSAALLSGDYQFEFGPEAVIAHVRLRCRRLNQPEAAREVMGSAKNVNALCAALADAALELLDQANAAPPTPFDVANEANLLADLGEQYLDWREPLRAVQPLMAAYALNPESFRVQALLMHATANVFASERNEKWARFTPEEQRVRLPMLFLFPEVALRLMNHPEFPKKADAEFHPHLHLSRLTFSIARGVSQSRLIGEYVGVEEKYAELRDQLRTACYPVNERLKQVTKPFRSPQVSWSADYITISYMECFAPWNALTPEEALSWQREILEEAVRVRGTFLSHIRERAGYELFLSPFATRTDLFELYQAFLDDLDRSPNVCIRAESLRARASFTHRELKQPVLARELYLRFLTMVLEEVMPTHPELDSEVVSWVSHTASANHLALPPADIIDVNTRLIRGILPRALMVNSNHLEHPLYNLIAACEKTGRLQEADEFLTEVLTNIPASNPPRFQYEIDRVKKDVQDKQSALRERFPHRVQPKPPLPHSLVTAEDLLNLTAPHAWKTKAGLAADTWKFRRIIPVGKNWAVVLTNPSLPGGERVALLRMGSDFRASHELEVLEEPLLSESRLVNVSMVYESQGPSVTVLGDAIFVGHPLGGIVHFRPSQPPVHYATRHANDSRPGRYPLPSDQIWQLTSTNDCVYALTGYLQQQIALLEIEPEQGTVRVLLSPRGSTADQPLNGHSFDQLSVSKTGDLLLRANGSYSEDPRGLFCYLKEQNRFEQLSTEYSSNSLFQILREDPFEANLNLYSAWKMDGFTGQKTFLMVREPSSANAHWVYDLNPGRYAYRDGHLVLLAYRLGHQELELLHFKPGATAPELLYGYNCPSGGHVKDLIWPTGGDLLLLTNSQLLRVPIPKSSSAEAAQRP